MTSEGAAGGDEGRLEGGGRIPGGQDADGGMKQMGTRNGWRQETDGKKTSENRDD
jgi:hypothetical protein